MSAFLTTATESTVEDESIANVSDAISGLDSSWWVERLLKSSETDVAAEFGLRNQLICAFEATVTNDSTAIFLRVIKSIASDRRCL